MKMDHGRILFVANREVRLVPKGWRHPVDGDGRHVPLVEEDYWDGEDTSAVPRMPATAGLSPDATEIMAYETTTEGTPIASAFPNTPEGKRALVNYCARHCQTFGDHTADAEAWAAILFGDAGITPDGASSRRAERLIAPPPRRRTRGGVPLPARAPAPRARPS